MVPEIPRCIRPSRTETEVVENREKTNEMRSL